MCTCPCGSGKPREPRYDGYGIFLCYTCEECYRHNMQNYRRDIMEHYETDEPIEPDE